MMRCLLQNEYVDLGNGLIMTVTQQFNIVNQLTLGYNSYWFDKYPPITHSLFIDLDDTSFNKVKEIMLGVKITHEELGLTGNRIAVILRSSPKSHHVVIPHSYSWSQVLFILSMVSQTYDLPQLNNYLIQCVTRGYCTLRLSPKNKSSIEPVSVVKIRDTETDLFVQGNREHFNLLKATAKHKNKLIHRKLTQFEKVIPMDIDVTNQIVTYYGTRKPKELKV